MLQTFFNIPSLTLSTRKILELAVLASIVGRVYNVDGVGLDISCALTDPFDLCRKHIKVLRDHVPKLKITFMAETCGANIVRTADESGGVHLFVTDQAAVRARDKAFSRRQVFAGMYANSGSGKVYEDTADDKKIFIRAPAVSSLVLDDYETITRQLRKAPDKFFERYLYAVERPSISCVAIDDISMIPSRKVIDYLNNAIEIAETLAVANVVMNVEWRSIARKYFDDCMSQRWEQPNNKEMNNAAYVKTKKMAALLALCRDLHEPKIEKADVKLALVYLDHERNILSDRLELEDLKLARVDDLYKRACEYLERSYEDGAGRNTKPRLHALGMIPVSHLLIMCSGLKSFAHDPNLTKKQGVHQAVKILVADGRFTILPKGHALSHSGNMGRIFTDIVHVTGYSAERLGEWR